MVEINRSGMNDYSVYGGVQHLPALLGEALRSVKGRLIQKEPPTLNRSLVQNYFENAKEDERSEGMIAAQSPLYEPLIISALQELRTMFNEFDEKHTIKILDYGCGTGQLYENINDLFQHFDYIGYDVDRKLTRKNIIKFSHITNSEIVSNLEHTECVNVIFAINLLCYLNEVEVIELFAQCNDLFDDRETNALVIIDPMPTWIWETRFSGIELCLRTPQRIKYIAESQGFSSKKTIKAHCTRLFGHNFISYAHCAIMVKSNQFLAKGREHNDHRTDA